MSFDDNANKLAFVDLDGHLEMLSDDLANALRPAKENKAKQRLALCRYYKSGVKAGIPWEHLTSYLGDGDFSSLMLRSILKKNVKQSGTFLIA